MNKKWMLIGLAACAFLAACDSETRDGQLTLSGPAPILVADEGGQAVEFGNGPVKVQLQARSGGKFTVSMEQAGRKARFTGQAPSSNTWNFTLLGKNIGQAFDLKSDRKVSLYGPIERHTGYGAPCGMNGRYITAESWQKGNEDWTVSFLSAGSANELGAFASHLKAQDYLVDSQDLYCQDRPWPEPHGHPREAKAGDVQPAKTLDASAVKFD